VHLTPDLPHTLDIEILLKDPFDLGLEFSIALSTVRQAGRIGPLGHVVIESGWGNRQNPANRLDPMIIVVIFDELDHFLNGRSSSACAKYAEALRRISLACFSSRFSRSNAFIFSAISGVMPPRWPVSTSTFLPFVQCLWTCRALVPPHVLV
jgi:hypothetical protein